MRPPCRRSTQAPRVRPERESKPCPRTASGGAGTSSDWPVLTPPQAASDKRAVRTAPIVVRRGDFALGEGTRQGRRVMQVLATVIALVVPWLGCRGNRDADVPEPEEEARAEVKRPSRPVREVKTGEAEWVIEESSSSWESEVKVEAPSQLPSWGTSRAQESPSSRSCCRICRKGKACGNTCIAAERACRTPPGCACDG